MTNTDNGAGRDSVQGRRILLINDSTFQLESLRLFLTKNGFTVEIASEGSAALEMVRRSAPDLVVSDVVMPGIDGVELCRRMKAAPPTSGIPVLLLTGLRYNDAGVVEGLEAGADDYLELDAPPSLLLKKAERLISQYRERRARLQAEADRNKAEEQLKQFAAMLEKSNRELEGFAYIASHDLQEPLRKIQAFGDRLKSKITLNREAVDYLDRMQGAARRMQTLITDLLKLSRVTTGARPFVRVDLSQVVKEVICDLELQIEQTAGTVKTGYLPTIEADPTQMRQLFQNLIGNALKFHRPGDPPVVRIEDDLLSERTGPAKPQVEFCRIVVEDNGIGFNEKHIDRIFAPFQRLHGRNEYDGTGIGLTVCQKIAERHNGTIAAESRPGDGARFVISLPMRQNLAARAD